MLMEYSEIAKKAMAYDLLQLFRDNDKERVYTQQEVEKIIKDYIAESFPKK